jgi:hypothetical protein
MNIDDEIEKEEMRARHPYTLPCPSLCCCVSLLIKLSAVAFPMSDCVDMALLINCGGAWCVGGCAELFPLANAWKKLLSCFLSERFSTVGAAGASVGSGTCAASSCGVIVDALADAE